MTPPPFFERFALLVVVCLLAGCGRSKPPSPSVPHPAAAAASTTALDGGSDESDHAESTGTLTAARAAELGLDGPGQASTLTPQLWSDPEAVAARFVLADTTYAAAADPTVVNAGRAAFTTPRLAADLAISSSGGARLEELRRREAAFVGEVLAITTGENTGGVAVVELTVRITMTSADRPPDPRVQFYRLTLGRDGAESQWLVARVQLS